MYKVTLTALAAALLLTACGGSDNKSSHKPSTPQVKVDKAWNFLDHKKDYYEKKAQASNVTLNHFSYTIGGKNYPNAQNINAKSFPQGTTEQPYRENLTLTHKASGKKVNLRGEGTMYLFQQKHSAAVLFHEKTWTTQEEGQSPQVDNSGSIYIKWLGDHVKTLPTSGKYHYHGVSYSADTKHSDNSQAEKGTFDYTIDFANKTGEGKIVDKLGVITLHQAPITKDEGTFGVYKGKASSKDIVGDYNLDIFGANAEEVVGKFTLGDESGIMGGTKK